MECSNSRNRRHDGDEKKTHGDRTRIHRKDHMDCGDGDDDDVSIAPCTISCTFWAFAFHSDDTFSYGGTCDVTFLDRKAQHVAVFEFALVDGKVLEMVVEMVFVLVS
jgi:hypothetical protein